MLTPVQSYSLHDPKSIDIAIQISFLSRKQAGIKFFRIHCWLLAAIFDCLLTLGWKVYKLIAPCYRPQKCIAVNSPLKVCSGHILKLQ